MSYTDAMDSVAAGQVAMQAGLEVLARSGQAHTALLVACIALSVVLLLVVGVLALLAWQWSRRVIEAQTTLLRLAQQPTPEHQRMSHAISDIDDAARMIGEVRDELRGLRTLAEAWLATKGVDSVSIGWRG